MSFLLALIPMPYRLAAELAFVALVIAAGCLWVHHDRTKHQAIGEARVQARWDAEKVQQQAEALKQAQANAAETQRRLKEQQDAQATHDQQLAQARADADTARTALDRLRARASAVAAAGRSAAGHPAAASNSQTASDPASVLADVLGQLGERARLLAGYADDARAAGQQCQSSYDALTHP